MMRARLIVLSIVALGAFVACESETGPDAPDRTNGCIDTDCNTSGSSSGGGDAGGDAQK